MGVDKNRKSEFFGISRMMGVGQDVVEDEYERFVRDFTKEGDKIKHFGTTCFLERETWKIPEEVRNLQGEKVLAFIEKGPYESQAIFGSCEYEDEGVTTHYGPVNPTLRIKTDEKTYRVSLENIFALYIDEPENYRDPGFERDQDYDGRRDYYPDVDFEEEVERDMAKTSLYLNYPFKKDIPDSVKRLSGETAILIMRNDEAKRRFTEIKGECTFVDGDVPRFDIRVNPYTECRVPVKSVASMRVKENEKDLLRWRPLMSEREIPDDVFKARLNRLPSSFEDGHGMESVNETARQMIAEDYELEMLYFGADLRDDDKKAPHTYNAFLTMEKIAEFGADADTNKEIFKNSVWGEEIDDATADKMAEETTSYEKKKHEMYMIRLKAVKNPESTKER